MSPITGLSTHRQQLSTQQLSTLKIGTGLSTHRNTLKIGTEHSGSQHNSTQRLSTLKIGTGLSTHRQRLSTQRLSTLKIDTGLSTHRSTLKIGTGLSTHRQRLSMSPITRTYNFLNRLSTQRLSTQLNTQACSTLKIDTEHNAPQYSSTHRQRLSTQRLSTLPSQRDRLAVATRQAGGLFFCATPARPPHPTHSRDHHPRDSNRV